jgi:hypothetical protein
LRIRISGIAFDKETNMKSVLTSLLILLPSLPVLAQSGGSSPPPAIQAIDTQLHQIRTVEQRKRMEAPAAEALAPPRSAAAPDLKTNPVKQDGATPSAWEPPREPAKIWRANRN